jgi:hypothetical protein
VVWRKVREWQQRYLLAELAGTATATAALLLAYAGTRSLGTAAVLASLGETVGFYAVILRQTLPALYRRHRRHGGVHRLWLTGRAAVAEASDYVLAETADTLLLRPGLVYLASTWLASQLVWGFLLGKIAADIGFYSMVIPSYELRKKLSRPRRGRP